MASKRVLIVDDELPVLSVLKSSLKKLGPDCEVRTALSGPSALQQMREYAFDLVVTDYRMTGMNGLDLMREIRSLHPAIRTILMTAYGSLDVEATARRLGACQYLVKPFAMDAFRTVVATALEEAHPSSAQAGRTSPAPGQTGLALDRLRLEVGARCVLLARSDGHVILRSGILEEFPVDEVVSKLAASLQQLTQLGGLLKCEQDAINLICGATKRANMLAASVGGEFFLIVVDEPSGSSGRLRSVSNAIYDTASKLFRELGVRANEDLKDSLDAQLAKRIADELDGLWLPGGGPGTIQNAAVDLKPAPSSYSQQAMVESSRPTIGRRRADPEDLEGNI